MESWRTEVIYYSSKKYFEDLISSILKAQNSVILETYIFDCDEIGMAVLEALRSAAQRGVKVRVVTDGVGSFFQLPKLKSLLHSYNVDYQVFHPLFLSSFFRWNVLWLRKIFQLSAKWNKRLHRKICLIDNNWLFLGSFNITNVAYRETGVQVTGHETERVLAAFESNWAGDEPYTINIQKIYNPNSLIRLNHTRRLRKSYSRDLRNRIARAKKRVWITNAYFIPPPSILRALIMEREKNVDIRILVPSRSVPWFMKLLTETYYRTLLHSGIRIFEYQCDFLHAKTLLIDDWALVGSSNWNHRSFLHDQEIDAVLTHKNSIESLESQFLIDCRSSLEINENLLPRRRWLDKLLIKFLQLIRYWL